MNENNSSKPKRFKLWLAPALLIGVVAQYFLVTRSFDQGDSMMRHVATLLGAVATMAGSFWIGVLALAPSSRPRAKVTAIVGPLGLTQVCAGLALLFWAAGLRTPMRMGAYLAIICALLSFVLHNRNRSRKQSGDEH